MSNDDRIVELLSDILIEQKGTRTEMRDIREEIHDMRGDIHEMCGDIREMRGDIKTLQEQQAKTNAAIGELRLSVMRLADDIMKITEHEGRIVRLEVEVFKS